jgi:hypothetical protein
MTSSNYMLVAITLDRHRAITRPLTVPGSPYRLVGAAWLISLIPSLPSINIFTVELRQSQVDSSFQPECVSDFTGWSSIWHKMYFSGVAVIIFLIPLVVFISLYSHIVSEICTAVASFTGRVSCYEYDEAVLDTFLLQAHFSNDSTHRRNYLLSRARIRTTNLSMVMVIIFIMTNLPYIVVEFFRQQFVFRTTCHTEFCHVLKVT